MKVALRAYDNPQCITVDEFNDDLRRFQSIKKAFLIARKDPNDINVRGILNNFVVCFNLFGLDTLDLFLFKIDRDDWDLLFPFLIALNQLPNEYAGIDISSVQLNKAIVNKLREI